MVRDRTRAPSWSWASVDGAITYPISIFSTINDGVVQIHEDYDLQVLNVTVQETHPGTFGAVSGGRIDAVAALYPITVVSGPGGNMSEPQLRYDSEPIHDYCLDEADLFKDTAPRPCWLARVYSLRGDGYETNIFYLMLQENEGGKESNLELSRIGMFELEYHTHDLPPTRFRNAAGVRKRIAIL
ncbi:hypothetical protein QBC37DRAFT_181895 [Rhypophila decipiens]|uniref:Uncharacterized protein n=1 Tax=Rhypophila decipiens TaxID=261697 RepID=A0AAN6Y5H8_9PEZI|nr:hypothetical protein QBC37DRAFT_181895 [Rhypophila decipiens]